MTSGHTNMSIVERVPPEVTVLALVAVLGVLVTANVLLLRRGACAVPSAHAPPASKLDASPTR